PSSTAGVAQGEALPKGAAVYGALEDRPQGRVEGSAGILGTPPEPRRERVLPIALRPRRDSHDGRCGRVDHDVARAGRGREHPGNTRDSLSPFSRAAL